MSDMRSEPEEEEVVAELYYDKWVKLVLFHLIKEAGGKVTIPPSAFVPSSDLALTVAEGEDGGATLELLSPEVSSAYLTSLKTVKH